MWWWFSIDFSSPNFQILSIYLIVFFCHCSQQCFIKNSLPVFRNKKTTLEVGLQGVLNTPRLAQVWGKKCWKTDLDFSLERYLLRGCAAWRHSVFPVMKW